MSAVISTLKFAGFRRFSRALHQSEYGALLDGGGPYTVFAPTDDAFAKFPSATLDNIFDDPALLRAVAGCHFAAGKVVSSRFEGKRIRAITFGGQSVVIDGKNGLRVEGASVVRPDILAGDCVIHGIDGVLWPREPGAIVL